VADRPGEGLVARTDGEARSYQCGDCRLHYATKELADACYEFCTTQHACSLDITRHSLERART